MLIAQSVRDECNKPVSRCADYDPPDSITPHLTLDNAADTIEWYKRALGAQELRSSTGPDGKIMHAELKVGDSFKQFAQPASK
jgi:hypothetical protein